MSDDMPDPRQFAKMLTTLMFEGIEPLTQDEERGIQNAAELAIRNFSARCYLHAASVARNRRPVTGYGDDVADIVRRSAINEIADELLRLAAEIERGE